MKEIKGSRRTIVFGVVKRGESFKTIGMATCI